MNERRSRLSILADILRLVAKENGKTKPTHILYGANLSHERLKKHLASLINDGFIQQTSEDGRTYYIITEKGRLFIQEYKKVKQFSDAFGIDA